MRTRTFVFKDAKSHKFWSIAVEGEQIVTRWGRVGTDGQEKPKAFASEAEAEAAAEKLVGEKVRKGYVEDGEGGLPQASVSAAVVAEAEPAAKVEEPAPAVAVEEPEPPPPPLAGARPPLDLTPGQWAIATWRPLPDPPAGLPEPFDLEAAAKELHTVAKGSWRWDWSSVPIRPLMTREEAAYWLVASREDLSETPKEVAKRLARGAPVPGKDGAFALATGSKLPHGAAMGALVHLVDPVDVLEWLLGPSPPPNQVSPWRPYEGDPRQDLMMGVREHLLPRLGEADRKRLAEEVRTRVQQALRQPDYDVGPEAILAAQLGLHDEVEAVVARWDDGMFSDMTMDRHAAVVFGLGSPDAVRETVQRTKLRLDTPRDVVAWLAHTELEDLGYIETSIARAWDRDGSEELARAFARAVHAPVAAPHMVSLVRGSRGAAIAKAWIDEHPAEVVRGLAPLVGRQGARAEVAEDQLRRIVRTAGAEHVERALDGFDEATVAAVRARVIEAEDMAELIERADWLAEGAEAHVKGKLPSWLDPAELPPLVLDGARLGPADVEAVLRALAASGPDDPAAPFLAALREHADGDSADAFAWAVFESWIAAGAPPKGRWAMIGIGHLGNDRGASRLAALIRVWPGESQHQRAVLGLSVLQAIGTDSALMLLNGIAQKLKYKALKQRAREAMDEIAKSKGMTREELEDRIVPDCGLDAEGRRTFDYGPRSFAFVLGPGMKPMVRDAAGKLRTSPPKPGARDDAGVAARSQEAWKLLRKQVADIAKIQAARLESAMVTGRSWSTADFRAFLVEHPLQRHLTRLLVLGAWHGDDGPRTFRLTEEGDLADAQDEPFELDDGDRVTVVHPLQLSDEERAAWGEMLADYEIVPPFPQLGRSIHDLEPDELDERDLKRYAKAKVPAVTLVGILERTGWLRGPALDNGIFSVHTRPFEHADVTAVVEYEGIPMGYMVDWDDQAIEHCYVVKGTVEPDWHWDTRRALKNALRWRDVDPIVRSEVLGSLNALASKAR